MLRLAPLFLLGACQKGPEVVDDARAAAIVAAVEARMRSFEAAERARDAERLVAHFANVPEFHVYNDGQRVSYAEMAASIRGTFPGLRSIEGGFGDVHVAVCGPDHALVSATFRETVTDGSGAVARRRGAASWLWREIDGEWRIVYGHVDHRPDSGEQAGRPGSAEPD